MGVVIHEDVKGLKELAKQLGAFGSMALTIGFQGAKALQVYPGTGVNVATVAAYNEFSPGRAFMRRTIEAYRVDISNFIANTARLVVLGMSTALDGMRDIGRHIARLMWDQMERSVQWARRNADSTIRAKGFNHPLVWTGRMQRSITWAVRSSFGPGLGNILLQGGP